LPICLGASAPATQHCLPLASCAHQLASFAHQQAQQHQPNRAWTIKPCSWHHPHKPMIWNDVHVRRCKNAYCHSVCAQCHHTALKNQYWTLFRRILAHHIHTMQPRSSITCMCLFTLYLVKLWALAIKIRARRAVLSIIRCRMILRTHGMICIYTNLCIYLVCLLSALHPVSKVVSMHTRL